jgi:DNA-binding GntR family transcriptional regulator
VDRVKWFRDRADRDRFREEVQILDAEFKRTIISFSRMSHVWNELAIKASSPGSAAYARKKAIMYRGLEEDCAQAYAAVLKMGNSCSST